ncbi:SDR family NAD(P)-dependent oxidoreductase [Streptomyces mirabilis]|uniref:SDR family NAD(P)-dependent oxidoreductase n=1 Tax=Streptomyces mirabilis TaxID=68239 RepID=UPI0036EBA585
MRNTLDGAVAVIAGGARGIGRASALRLADLGATVAVIDVNLEAAAEYGEQLTADSVQVELQDRAGSGVGIQADLTDPEATAQAIQDVYDVQQRLDILVIPAGGAVTPAARSAASVTPDEDFTTIVDVNMRTVVNCCRAAVPHMRESGGGAIVTMASQSALWVTPNGSLAAYGMAKAGVVQYTRYLAAEVGPWGIRANCIAPGVIRTSRLVQQQATVLNADDAAKAIPLRRQGEPSDIADAVQYLTTPLSAYVTGQVLAVDGGSTMH